MKITEHYLRSTYFSNWRLLVEVDVSNLFPQLSMTNWAILTHHCERNVAREEAIASKSKIISQWPLSSDDCVFLTDISTPNMGKQLTVTSVHKQKWNNEEFVIIYGEKKHKISHFMNFLISTCFACSHALLEAEFCFRLFLPDKCN